MIHQVKFLSISHCAHLERLDQSSIALLPLVETITLRWSRWWSWWCMLVVNGHSAFSEARCKDSSHVMATMVVLITTKTTPMMVVDKNSTTARTPAWPTYVVHIDFLIKIIIVLNVSARTPPWPTSTRARSPPCPTLSLSSSQATSSAPSRTSR